MSHRRAGAALAVAALALTACGGGDDDVSSAATEAPPATSGTTATSGPAATSAASTAAPATTTATGTTAPSATAPSGPATTAPDTATTAPAVGDELWEDPTGTFRIAFPVAPSTQNVQAPLPDGTSIPVTAYLAEVAGAAAIASCVEDPDGSIGDLTATLDAARDGALANIGAELVDSEPIELQGRPGVSYRGVIGEAGSVLARTFVDGLQLCQVLVVGEPTVIEESAASILDSFEFVKEAA